MQSRLVAFIIVNSASHSVAFHQGLHCLQKYLFIRVSRIQKVKVMWASSLQNLSSGFLTKRDSNQSPQLQRLARKLNFHLYQV